MSIVERIHEIRNRDDFSANDITVIVIDGFEELYDINPSAMKTEVYIREENVRGRADVMVETGIGIETKSNLPDEREKAETQIYNALTKLENEGYNSPVGIATDGVYWSFYVKVKDEPYEYYDFEVTPEMNDEEFAANLWDGLTPLREKANRPDPTAQKIAETFRPHGPAFNEIMSRFRSEVTFVLENEPVEFTSKFIPWFEVFNYVYNNFDERCKDLASYNTRHSDIVEHLQSTSQLEDETEDVLTGALELYLRHTYLAVMAKTLSSMVTLGEETVTEQQLTDPDAILTGEAARQNGVQISDPNDYFAWLQHAENPGKVLESILKPLKRFSNNYTDDVFRHIYEQVVEPDTRHELGEFFTPKWTGEMMVSENVVGHGESVLDPACGSGTFLVFALRQKINQLEAQRDEFSSVDIGEILDETWGIDINPLSVILARTNIYLTLVTTVEPADIPQTIKPRVITADTFVNPRFREQQRQLPSDGDEGQSLVNVPISDEINVPVLPELSVDEAQQIIDQCGELMEDGRSEIPAELRLDGQKGQYQQAIFQTMTDLRDKYGDSLWKFILRNYGVPPLLAGEFDVVVGNPPWLSYREASGQIKETMNKIADYNDINPPAHAKTSFNLAIAFFMSSLSFLNDEEEATISFVLPLSVLDSAAHTNFLDLIQTRDDYTIETVYDLENINPNPFPHTLPSAILTVEKQEEDN